MNSMVRILSSVLAALTVSWPHQASAQSPGPSACAAIAPRGADMVGAGAMHAEADLQQAMRAKRFLRCLSAQGQSPSAGAGSPAAAASGAFVTFDVPGSKCLPSFPRCIGVTAINLEGAVTGFYSDANAANHGFLRTPGGAFVKFDVPGAVCASFFSFCTYPTAINAAGTITGWSSTGHGFLRSPDGAITEFDPPGAACCTTPTAINEEGTVAGSYADANFAFHGFVRRRSGDFVTFDDPAAINGASPVSINLTGEITGASYDANYNRFGFLRTRDGAIVDYDPPGSVYTNPVSINVPGAITGSYCDPDSCHGFLRSPTGATTVFDVPGAFPGSTSPSGVNLWGEIAGGYQGGTSLHGFLRGPFGAYTTFDPPGSLYTWRVTGPNLVGAVAGSYVDARYLEHGYIRFP